VKAENTWFLMVVVYGAFRRNATSPRWLLSDNFWYLADKCSRKLAFLRYL